MNVAVSEKTSVTLKAGGRGTSHSLTHVTVRDLDFAIDEPAARGGTNLGPTPTDTAIAALIGCTNVIAHKCARQLGIDIGHLEISAECEFDRRGVTLQEEIEVPFVRIALLIEADGPASEADLHRVAEQVKRFCPLSKLFSNSGTQIGEIWRKK